jgi:hypothetical protein
MMSLCVVCPTQTFFSEIELYFVDHLSPLLEFLGDALHNIMMIK